MARAKSSRTTLLKGGMPELIQDDATPAAMVEKVGPLLAYAAIRDEQLAVFGELHDSLSLGYAERSARAISQFLDARAQGHG